MMVIYVISSIICFIHAGWMIEHCDGYGPFRGNIYQKSDSICLVIVMGFGIFPVINTFMAVIFTTLLLLDKTNKNDKSQSKN